jgi:Mg2+/Co2+ transporter CorB
MENIFEVLGLGTLEFISAMTFLTIIMVEVLKKIIPDKFPTRILTLIVAEIVAIVIPILNPAIDISVISIITSILNGFVIAFISMNGFDSLKGIWQRLIKADEGEDDENV